MTVTANLAARLAETIGAQHVVAVEEELEAYAVDDLVPSVIVRPGSAEEVTEVVRFAAAERLAVLPFGSRSKCEMGMSPSRYDIAVDMTGLREIVHYDAGDLTLSVDAGMPLRELEVYLKRHRQFLPLAVPCFESTTAAGTVASGIDSALRQQYGSARDFLIGAEFVDGTGQVCKSGGRVVKNVTGYDLHKLLIGSLGTLGVITRLNFRTFPLAAVSGGHVANFANSEGALSYQRAVEKAGLPLGNLEVLSPKVTEMIHAILQREGERLPAELERGEWCVYSSFEGSEAVVRRISGDLERVAREAGALRCKILETAEDEPLGGMLRESFEWLRWGSPANVIYRLALPEVRPEILEELSQLSESVSLRAGLLVRAAGVVYFAVFAGSEEESAIAPLQKIVTGVASVARTRRGHATLLHAPSAIKAKAAAMHLSKFDMALQQRVKQAFDPAGVFAPGRVVGGV
ncbi:MAG: FAD-binding oxidoreductase [Candidatus Acidiferrum sp.]